MGLKMRKNHCHSVALKVNEQMGTKIGYTFIQSNRAWLPKALVLWIMGMAFIGMSIYRGMDEENKIRRKEVLGSMCDQRARMLQDQFNVTVNHVHALTILVSTFHYFKNPSALDQVFAFSFSFAILIICSLFVGVFRICLTIMKTLEEEFEFGNLPLVFCFTKGEKNKFSLKFAATLSYADLAE